jgi:energy-coupling factor transporter ATP-binding protein EcfA2
MIVETDRIRAYWLGVYGKIGPACGRGDKRVRQIVEAWVEAGRQVVVIWGPPGSGKSTIIEQYDNAETLVVETTGLVKAQNKFFRSLPSDQVTFVCHVAPRKVCKKRVLARKNHPMGDNGAELVQLVDRWFTTPKKQMLG